MFVYSFGPFAFHSDLELPEVPALAIGDKATGVAVRIEYGVVPRILRSATFQGQFCSATRSEFLLNIEGTARYYVRAGCEIVVEQYPGAAATDVRAFLLGNVFAVLCHQRQLLPLHASAVRVGDGVIAFLGASGAGKSTLAGFLAQAGYPLVADDICLLDPSAPVESRVMPVASWLKLWRGSLKVLGHGVDGLSQTFSDEDKFRLPVGHLAAASPARLFEDGRPQVSVQKERLPLRAVIVLARKAEAANHLGKMGVTLEALKPVQAIAQMMRFTYQAFLLDWLGVQAEHFARCGKGLEGATGYTCERPWGFDSLPLMLDCVQENFGA